MFLISMDTGSRGREHCVQVGIQTPSLSLINCDPNKPLFFSKLQVSRAEMRGEWDSCLLCLKRVHGRAHGTLHSNALFLMPSGVFFPEPLFQLWSFQSSTSHHRGLNTDFKDSRNPSTPPVSGLKGHLSFSSDTGASVGG